MIYRIKCIWKILQFKFCSLFQNGDHVELNLFHNAVQGCVSAGGGDKKAAFSLIDLFQGIIRESAVKGFDLDDVQLLVTLHNKVYLPVPVSEVSLLQPQPFVLKKLQRHILRNPPFLYRTAHTTPRFRIRAEPVTQI